MKFPIIGADNTALGTGTSAQYNFISATHQSSWNSTETNRDIQCAAAMTAQEFRVRVATAPGVGNTRVFKLFKAGSATALVVTISGTDTYGSITGESVSYAAGDTISIESTATGTPADTTDVYWSIVAESVGSDYFIVFSGSGSTANGTVYQQLQNGAGGWLASDAVAQQIFPLAGTINTLYLGISISPGTGDEWDFTIMHNSVGTALTINFAGTETGWKNVSSDVAFIAGDTVSMEALETGIANTPNVAWSAKITPTTAGQSCIMLGTGDAPSTASTEYEQIMGGGNNSWITTEANRHSMLGPINIIGMRAKVGTAPGAGKSWTFKVREDSADITGASLAVADANTINNNNIDIDITENTLNNWSCTPAGTPTAMTGGAHLSLMVFFSPAVSITMDMWHREAITQPNKKTKVVASGFIPPNIGG